MRTVEIQVFEFDELSKEVQAKVITEIAENELFDYLEDILTDWVQEELKSNNIEMLRDFHILYDLSHTQGSGLCFTGIFKWKEYKVIIEHTSNYYNHKNSVEIKLENEDGDIIEDDKLFGEFEGIYDKICDKVEKVGYKEIEYQNSEEATREKIKENEWEFYKDGRIYSG